MGTIELITGDRMVKDGSQATALLFGDGRDDWIRSDPFSKTIKLNRTGQTDPYIFCMP